MKLSKRQNQLDLSKEISRTLEKDVKDEKRALDMKTKAHKERMTEDEKEFKVLDAIRIERENAYFNADQAITDYKKYIRDQKKERER